VTLVLHHLTAVMNSVVISQVSAHDEMHCCMLDTIIQRFQDYVIKILVDSNYEHGVLGLCLSGTWTCLTYMTARISRKFPSTTDTITYRSCTST
jgi:hypothetical protein